MNNIITEDLAYIHASLGPDDRDKLRNTTLLVTGCGGFLGYYMMHFLSAYADELRVKRIVGLDNFMLRRPQWIDRLRNDNSKVEIHEFDIIRDEIGNIPNADKADLIVHMASIASPSFYRRFPIETLDANVTGLRSLLEYYAKKPIKGFLFMSSSEIYGDPASDDIPTNEEYRGNVSTIGPRACYDEAKRFGETLCYLYAQQYGMPITIVRPFNNYGPGMHLDDKRVPADFAKAIVENRDIEMFSDGTPTRTFCYIADAITGYLKALSHGKFEYFNIGTDAPELSIRGLADLYVGAGKKLLNYTGTARFAPAPDKEYLVHNPSRRCPNIHKARTLLNYRPSISVEDGVVRFLSFLHSSLGVS